MQTTKQHPVITAYCWASGRIEFTSPKRRPKVPEGAIALAAGPAPILRRIVNVLARHGYGKSEGILLVPGVPEASLFKKDPVEAVGNFARLLRRSLAKQTAA